MRGASRAPAAGPEGCLTSLGLHSPCLPPPPRGPPSLPHQDTEHCMNSGLNGIISEFWSTASSGCFTNYLSLLCGGQNMAWGQVTDARGPVHCLGVAVPHPWQHPGLCRQMVHVSLAPSHQPGGDQAQGGAQERQHMARPWHARALKSAWAQEARVTVLN